MTRILIAATLALASCAPMPPVSDTTTKVQSAIDRAEAAYLRAKPFADLAVAFRPEWATYVHDAETRIEAGIAAARAAVTLVEQEAALAQAQAAMVDLAKASAPAK